MEDILASIRRIIAEGEQDAKDGTDCAAAAEAAEAGTAEGRGLRTDADRPGRWQHRHGRSGGAQGRHRRRVEQSRTRGRGGQGGSGGRRREAGASPEAAGGEGSGIRAFYLRPRPSDTKVESAMAALSRLMDIAKTPGPEASAVEPERQSFLADSRGTGPRCRKADAAPVARCQSAAACRTGRQGSRRQTCQARRLTQSSVLMKGQPAGSGPDRI